MKKISPRRTRAHATTTLAIVLVAAACGGEKNADPPATSAAVPNTTPATILPPATDPALTTTTAPTTTTAAPTPSTTPELSEEDRAKQAVIAAAQNAWYLFNEAKLDPTNAQKTEAAVLAYTGDAQRWVSEYLAQYDQSNQRSVTSEIAPARIDVYDETVELNLGDGIAKVEACDVNSNVMVEIAGNGDGSDRVLDDVISAYRTRTTLQLVSGHWLVSGAEDLIRYEGSVTCDAG